MHKYLRLFTPEQTNMVKVMFQEHVKKYGKSSVSREEFVREKKCGKKKRFLSDVYTIKKVYCVYLTYLITGIQTELPFIAKLISLICFKLVKAIKYLL